MVGVLATPDPSLGFGADPVSVLVATDAAGVTRVDDWDGFGQRMTGSGTTIFDGVRVEADDVLARPAAPGHAGAFVQLVLLAALTGIGRAVVDDAARYVRERTRSFSHASADLPRHDPLVQEVVGDLSAASFAADAALGRAVAALQRAAEAQHPDSTADLATAQAQLVIVPTVLRAATELFEVGGASALGESLALDRHWRNARALSSHNPARYKARIVGDHIVNSTPIVAWWTSGEA
ncbi:alkylation response protein AidB-like acyl-CoA dehydrogenase [Microbacterium sp. AK009]|uniref:acyl-CoA dehydrogenase family protein n=1 Tax=Microbacterium sp. AK009 TaxID=2723068 RepID=UPI0017DE710B|nr:acyl-CoA dehydrogenase family protein [Microbacterium sp. AK009]NYF16938.1 alkylation response protein AidB-like acyl-CoA dehydrogenase [Microbacterium sp. AK009]